MSKRIAILALLVLPFLQTSALAARPATRHEAHTFYRLTLAAFSHQGWRITARLVSTVEPRWAVETVYLRAEETRIAETITVLFYRGHNGTWEDPAAAEESHLLGCPPGDPRPSSKTRRDLHLGACPTYAENPEATYEARQRAERKRREQEQAQAERELITEAAGTLLHKEQECRENGNVVEVSPEGTGGWEVVCSKPS